MNGDMTASSTQQVTSRDIGMSQDMTGFGLMNPMAEGTTTVYDVPSSIDTNLRDPQRAFNKYEALMNSIDMLQLRETFTHESDDYNYTIKRLDTDRFLSLRTPKRDHDTYVHLQDYNREQLNNHVTCWVQEFISRELRGNSEDEIQ
jgi:hypothetical protein